jgi:hypothetical protein
MTYSQSFLLHTAEGHFGPGGSTVTDVWRVSLKLAPIGAPLLSEAAKAAFLAAAEPLWVAFHTNTNVSPGANCFLTALTAAHIGEDGKYLGLGTQGTTRRVLGSVAGGSGTANLPWSTACAYTLRTTILRGRGSRGRFFYPACGTAVGATDGLWSSSVTQARATAGATLIAGLNAFGDDLAPPALAVVRVMSNLGLGVDDNVVRVEVGRKPDRQERRESELREDYRTANV